MWMAETRFAAVDRAGRLNSARPLGEIEAFRGLISADGTRLFLLADNDCNSVMFWFCCSGDDVRVTFFFLNSLLVLINSFVLREPE